MPGLIQYFIYFFPSNFLKQVLNNAYILRGENYYLIQPTVNKQYLPNLDSNQRSARFLAINLTTQIRLRELSLQVSLFIAYTQVYIFLTNFLF